jgi:hypothetical protein
VHHLTTILRTRIFPRISAHPEGGKARRTKKDDEPKGGATSFATGSIRFAPQAL